MKREYVEKVYNAQSAGYGLTHPLIFGGWDRSWRQAAAWLCRATDGGRVLDVCSGQGHTALECLKVWDYQGVKDMRATGIDISEGMLRAGAKRIEKLGFSERIELTRGDAMEMRLGRAREGFAAFEDETFDAAVCVFGAGGIEDPKRAFKEMARVTKKGGSIVVVESSLPIAGLHAAAGGKGVLRKIRVSLMRKLWGWENMPELNSMLEELEIDCGYGKKRAFKTTASFVIPAPRLFLRKAISVFSGEKA